MHPQLHLMVIHSVPVSLILSGICVCIILYRFDGYVILTHLSTRTLSWTQFWWNFVRLLHLGQARIYWNDMLNAIARISKNIPIPRKMKRDRENQTNVYNTGCCRQMIIIENLTRISCWICFSSLKMTLAIVRKNDNVWCKWVLVNRSAEYSIEVILTLSMFAWYFAIYRTKWIQMVTCAMHQ